MRGKRKRRVRERREWMRRGECEVMREKKRDEKRRGEKRSKDNK
jgi:hypothetical protein